jgi:hypothetical protein
LTNHEAVTSDHRNAVAVPPPPVPSGQEHTHDAKGGPPALEPYVDPKAAARFLSISCRRVLDMARAGILPAHPLADGQRHTWRFLLSELAAWLRARVN